MRVVFLYFHHIFLYYFLKNEKNATQATKMLRDVYADKVLQKRQCRRWFVKFSSGDY